VTRLLLSVLITATFLCAVLYAHHRNTPRSLTATSPLAVGAARAGGGDDPVASVLSHRPPRPRQHHVPRLWRQLAFCESTNRWDIVDPPYSGGLQFMASTWKSFHGTQFAPTADQATPYEQVVVARRVLRSQGVGAWPVCGPKVGLR
jgi:hypothetical protein